MFGLVVLEQCDGLMVVESKVGVLLIVVEG